MRKAGIAIGVLLSVVIVVLLFFWATFDVNDYRGPIQAQLQTRLNRPVTLGAMELTLLPLRFQIENLVIGDDPVFANPKPFIQAQHVRVSARLFALLKGNIELTSLDLQQPVIELVKNRQGVWNFSSLGALGKAQTAPRSRGHRSLSLGRLSVEDGQVAVTDRQVKQLRQVYSNVDLTLENLVPDKPFSIQLAIQLPGKGAQKVQFEGSGGPVSQAALVATPIHGTLELEGVRLAALQQFLAKPVLTDVDGTLNGKIRIDLHSRRATANGEMSMEDGRVRTVDLGYPITTQFTVSSDLKSDRVTIEKGTVKLGSTLVSIGGTLDLTSSPTRLGLTVKTDNMSLAEAARLAPAFGLSFPPNTEIGGRISSDFRIQGTSARPALGGALSATDVHVGGKHLPQPLHIPAVSFRLTSSTIQSSEFQVRSGETAVKSRVEIRNYAAEVPVIDARLDAPGAQFSSIVALAKAYGVTALNNVTGDGTLSLRMRLAGPVRSLTGDAVLRALQGRSEMAFDHVQVSGTNLSREISALAGFLKPTGGERQLTEISNMTGKINVTNGIARTEDLKATLDLGTIAVRGTFDLVSHKLNLRVNAVVDQRVSEQAGGTSIGGYMKTALQNQRGEIVVPVLVTGTFENPSVLPDVESFARMKLAEVLPTSGNPVTGLPGVIGDLMKNRSGNQKQQPDDPSKKQKPAEDVLQQILEGLSKQKPKQEENPPKTEE